MIIGINQPYYLPYIGFFERAKACDLFIINPYTPINRKRTYHRRSKIIQLHPNAEKNYLYLTQFIESKYDKQYFSNIELNDLFWKRQKIHIQTIYRTYKKSYYFPYVKNIFDLMDDKNCRNLGEYNTKLILFLAKKLFIADKFLDIGKGEDIPADILTNNQPEQYKNKATYTNLYLCRKFGATVHFAGQNGPLWLNEKIFEEYGVKVKYQRMKFLCYKQYSKNSVFVGGLSILDLLFNCGPNSVNELGRNSSFVNRDTLLKTTVLTGR